MKKFIIAGLSVLLLAGCATPQEIQPEKEEMVVNASEEGKYPFPKDTTLMGEGKVIVITPSGTSENGNTPTVFVKKDTLIQQVEIELKNFQSDQETFVYVDHVFEDTHQVHSITKTTIELKQKTLEQGNHTVTAVQFENNDPNGKVTSFAQAQFENKGAS